MGCSTSSPAGGPSKPTAGDSAANQRGRRLSTAPTVEASKELPKALGEVGYVPKPPTPLEAELLDEIKSECVSLKGKAPFGKKKMNQDRAMRKLGLQGDRGLHAFGVMDGHGEFGHNVSDRVQRELALRLEQEKDLRTDTANAMIRAVKSTCDDLQNNSGIQIAFSGTTCVFGVQVDRKFFIGNIGDSRCIVIKQKGDKCEALDLSTDQKPDSPGEKERIIAKGGRVEPLPGLPAHDCGPMRVWLADYDVPGLAMSRSIGDTVSHQAGVISVPEVKEYDIVDEDIFILWASDGVWEFIESQEAAEIVWGHRNEMDEACRILCDESSKRWQKEEEVIDDITCVMVQLNPLK